MLTGTIINTLAIVAGSLIGLAIQAVTKHSADDVSADSLGGRLQALVMQGMALCVLYIGISGSLKGENTLVIIISIALGAVIGELLDLDAKMHALGDWVQKKTARLVHTDEGLPQRGRRFCDSLPAILRRRHGHCRVAGKRPYRQLRYSESQGRDRRNCPPLFSPRLLGSAFSFPPRQSFSIRGRSPLQPDCWPPCSAIV